MLHLKANTKNVKLNTEARPNGRVESAAGSSVFLPCTKGAFYGGKGQKKASQQGGASVSTPQTQEGGEKRVPIRDAQQKETRQEGADARN